MLRPLSGAVLAFALPLAAQDARRFPADHTLRGLPRDAAAFTPYHADTGHPLNTIWRTLWLQTMAPAEVAVTVDTPPLDEWTEGWVHKKRKGTPADRRLYGGDGRLLPLEGLDEATATTLAAQLATLTADAAPVAQLRTTPALAVLFQHDLLRAADRLRETKQNPALQPALVAAARAVALAPDELARLADPLRAMLASDAGAALRRELPAQLGGEAAGWHEILRRSTRLFDAEKTLLWSRLFLHHPGGKEALLALLPHDDGGKGKGPTVPLGLRAVLVQGVVAFDRDGKAVATPLTFEVRTQTLVNREPLGAANATFTRDGIDFAIWQLEREGLRHGAPAAFFRSIAADDHDLFRDYGTAKYTTYRGQCTLCHRLSDTPEPQLGGFPVLRPHVQAHLATTGDERKRLAEEQAAKLWAALAR